MRLPEPDRLRGIAILFVVAIHAFSYLKIPGGGAWDALWFAVHQTAVPAFFLADGWLYGKRRRRPMSGAEQTAFLSASARRLLAPWLVFSLIYLGLRLVTQAIGVAGGAPVAINGPAALLLAIWRGAAAEGLYFLPALMIVRLATPLLHRLALGAPVRAAGLAALLMVGWRLCLEPRLQIPAVGVDPVLAGMTGLCFAAVGWALAEAPTRMQLRSALAPAALLALAAFALDGRAAAMCGQTAAVLALWGLAVALPARLARPSEWLGRRTMEIYLLHAPYIIKVVCVAAALLPPALGLPIAVAGATAGALALAHALDRLGLGWLWEGQARGSRSRPDGSAVADFGRRKTT